MDGSQSLASPQRPFTLRPFFLWCCFFGFALIVGGAGSYFYHYQKQTTIAAAHTNLLMLADLKAHQIGHWRMERLVQAQMLADNPFLLRRLRNYLTQPNAELAHEIRRSLQTALGSGEDRAIIFIDPLGKALLHVGDIVDWQQHIDQSQQQLALQQRQALFGKIYHRHPQPHPAKDHRGAALHAPAAHPHLHMNLTLPLFDDDSLGALVFIINPEAFLLPLVQSWPVPSATAESILTRKLGDSILRLTPVRSDTQQQSLVLQQPPPGNVSIGDALLNEQQGLFTGYDFRRVRVFAAIKKVPDSPWQLVAKIDCSEVLAPLYSLKLAIIATAAVIIIVAGAMLLFWRRYQQAHHRADHYQQELRHRTLSSRFANLNRFSNDLVVLCNQDGMILDANQRALQAYDQTIDTLRGKKLGELCSMAETEGATLWQQLQHSRVVQFSTNQLRADNSSFPVEITASWIELDNQKLLQAIIHDVSERHHAKALLTHQSQHDLLTGLPNRQLLTERLQRALGRTSRRQTRTTLLLLDLDRFKNINDTLGHSVGDKLLAVLAQRICESLDSSATVARFGGDEFAIMVEDSHDLAAVALLAIRLTTTISQPIFIDQQEMYITTSIGISVAPDDADDAEQLIRFADTAMYRAKELGRNNYQFFTPDMNKLIGERVQLETSLRKALERQELVVYYQPQLDMVSGQIVGSEALVRWQHPSRGLVPPNDFIPLAEETGLIDQIGQWVLEQACRQNKQWQQQGFTDLRVAVNLSARQFRNHNLAGDILTTLADSGLSPHSLELELTESLLMHDVENSIELMQTLSRHGISLAIDDFGTGYSSLNYLHRFPIHKLKIDRSFVSAIDSDSEGTIARSIIALAEELNLFIIAEGIETEMQRDFLCQLNCHYGQGYLFSRPLPAQQFGELLHSTAAQPLAMPTRGSLRRTVTGLRRQG